MAVLRSFDLHGQDGGSVVVRHVSGEGQTVLERFVGALHRFEFREPSRQYRGTL